MMPTQAWLTTDQPDLVFENTAVGRMKKEIWEADEAQLDAILAEYGVPAPGGCEWAKPGSYIQTRYATISNSNGRRMTSSSFP